MTETTWPDPARPHSRLPQGKDGGATFKQHLMVALRIPRPE